MQLDFLPVILDHLHRLCDTTGGTDPVAKRSEVPPVFASSLVDVVVLIRRHQILFISALDVAAQPVGR